MTRPTRAKDAPPLKSVPTPPATPRERQDPAIELLGATGSTSIMEMDEHTTGDLLVHALGAAPWMCLDDSIRFIAHELHFIADAFESADAGNYHSDVIGMTFNSITDRLLVIAELEGRLRRHYIGQIDKLEAEVAALKGGAS